MLDYLKLKERRGGRKRERLVLILGRFIFIHCKGHLCHSGVQVTKMPAEEDEMWPLMWQK